MKIHNQELEIKAQNEIIAFSAYNKGGNFYESDFLTFTNFHSQIGNGLDLKSGIFTAPISGFYSFSFHGQYHFDFDVTAVEILHNGSRVAMIDAFKHSDDHGFSGYLSYSWMLDLKQNDQVRLRVFSGEIYVYPFHYMVFNGQLIGSLSA